MWWERWEQGVRLFVAAEHVPEEFDERRIGDDCAHVPTKPSHSLHRIDIRAEADVSTLHSHAIEKFSTHAIHTPDVSARDETDGRNRLPNQAQKKMLKGIAGGDRHTNRDRGNQIPSPTRSAFVPRLNPAFIGPAPVVGHHDHGGDSQVVVSAQNIDAEIISRGGHRLAVRAGVTHCQTKPNIGQAANLKGIARDVCWGSVGQRQGLLCFSVFLRQDQGSTAYHDLCFGVGSGSHVEQVAICGLQMAQRKIEHGCPSLRALFRLLSVLDVTLKVICLLVVLARKGLQGFEVFADLAAVCFEFAQFFGQQIFCILSLILVQRWLSVCCQTPQGRFHGTQHSADGLLASSSATSGRLEILFVIVCVFERRSIAP